MVEDLEQMLVYAKCMKDLVTKKRSVIFENANRMQHCSAIATRSLVQKKKDPGRSLFLVQSGNYILQKHYVIWGKHKSYAPLDIQEIVFG